MRGFWRTLSFSFGAAMIAASLLRLSGLVWIAHAGDARLVLLVFAVCAVLSGGSMLLRRVRVPDWFCGFVLAAGGVFLGTWVLQIGLALAPDLRTFAFSAILTAAGFAGALALNRLTEAALAADINDALRAMHDERTRESDKDHTG